MPMMNKKLTIFIPKTLRFLQDKHAKPQGATKQIRKRTQPAAESVRMGRKHCILALIDLLKAVADFPSRLQYQMVARRERTYFPRVSNFRNFP